MTSIQNVIALEAVESFLSSDIVIYTVSAIFRLLFI